MNYDEYVLGMWFCEEITVGGEILAGAVVRSYDDCISPAPGSAGEVGAGGARCATEDPSGAAG